MPPKPKRGNKAKVSPPKQPQRFPKYEDTCKIVNMLSSAYKRRRQSIPWLGDPDYQSSTFYKHIQKLQKMIVQGKTMADVKASIDKEKFTS